MLNVSLLKAFLCETFEKFNLVIIDEWTWRESGDASQESVRLRLMMTTITIKCLVIHLHQ